MTKERIFTRNFWFAFGAMFGLVMVMYCLTATITEYAQSFGATELLAGMISGIYYVGGIAFRLWGGYGMNRYGWKRVAVFGIAFHALTCFGYFFVKNVWMLLAVRFLHGVGFGLSAATVLAIGLVVLPKSRHGEASGYMMLSMTISVALGPFAGGLIYDAFGPVGCFIFAQAMCILALVCTLCVDLDGIVPKNGLPPEQLPQERGLRRYVEKGAVPIGICSMLLAIGYTSLMSFYRLYGVQLGMEREFQRLFLIYAAVLVFSRPLAGKIQDRFGPDPICINGILTDTVGLIAIALRPCTATIILCGVCMAIGYGSITSVLASASCRSVPIKRHSYATSTFWVLTDVGTGFGPLILGSVLTAFGSYPVMYLSAAGISFLTLFIYLAIRKKRPD